MVEGDFILKMGEPRPLFCFYFRPLVQKILDVSWIQTRIVRVEGEAADRQTTTMACFVSPC